MDRDDHVYGLDSMEGPHGKTGIDKRNILEHYENFIMLSRNLMELTSIVGALAEMVRTMNHDIVEIKKELDYRKSTRVEVFDDKLN